MKYYIGIDLGGTNMVAGLVDETGRLLVTRGIPTDSARGPDDMIARMAALAEETAAAGGMALSALAGVGVGVPGACDVAAGVVRLACNVGWRDVPLAAALGGRLGLPVFLGNDADAAALGEVCAGAAIGCDSALMITLGTGVGGGLVMDGRVFCGCGGEGTEPGHTTLVLDGQPCGCGQRGCFEAYASATALIRQTRHAMEACRDSAMWRHADGALDNVDGRTAFTCAKAGDEAASRVVAQYVTYLAAGIGSLVNVFRPARVILGGGVSNQKEYLVDLLTARLRDYCFGADHIPPPPVVCATLGNDAGVIGAALLAR